VASAVMLLMMMGQLLLGAAPEEVPQGLALRQCPQPLCGVRSALLMARHGGTQPLHLRHRRHGLIPGTAAILPLWLRGRRRRRRRCCLGLR
jgi:hypothetical protein